MNGISSVVIGYPSGQDGVMLPARDNSICSLCTIPRKRDIGLVIFGVFMNLDTQRKNLANFQPYYMANSVTRLDEEPNLAL